MNRTRSRKVADEGPPNAGEYWATLASDRALCASSTDFWSCQLEIDALRPSVNLAPRAWHSKGLGTPQGLAIRQNVSANGIEAGWLAFN